MSTSRSVSHELIQNEIHQTPGQKIIIGMLYGEIEERIDLPFYDLPVEIEYVLYSDSINADAVMTKKAEKLIKQRLQDSVHHHR